MSWWNRLWRTDTVEAEGVGLPTMQPRMRVVLTLPGWHEAAPTGDLRIWHDGSGDVLSLATTRSTLDLAGGGNETALRRGCRKFAEGHSAGLIEAHAIESPIGPSTSLVYKRLQKPAYVYTGMFITIVPRGSVVWTVVAGERGTTGVREAVVTGNLMNAGLLTLDDYRSCWAQDPYEPTFHRVDRSVLRFMSDDEKYDEQFPDHPLSKSGGC